MVRSVPRATAVAALLLLVAPGAVTATMPAGSGDAADASGADLRVVHVDVLPRGVATAAGETQTPFDRRVVRATIVNEGAGDAGASTVAASVHATMRVPAATTEWRTFETLPSARIGALAAGASVVVEWSWDTAGNFGDQEVRVTADALGEVAETRDDNNVGAARTWVAAGNVGGVALPTRETLSPETGGVRALGRQALEVASAEVRSTGAHPERASWIHGIAWFLACPRGGANVACATMHGDYGYGSGTLHLCAPGFVVPDVRDAFRDTGACDDYSAVNVTARAASTLDPLAFAIVAPAAEVAADGILLARDALLP